MRSDPAKQESLNDNLKDTRKIASYRDLGCSQKLGQGVSFTL